MKILFLALLIPIVVIAPAYGQLLSDATGLVNRFDVEMGGHTFEVQVVSNFNVIDFEYDEKSKLTLYIESGLENNLGEVIIPQQLLSGELIFYLDDEEFTPQINSSERVSFVTLEFVGTGKHTVEILEAESLSDSSTPEMIGEQEDLDSSMGGGCLIATATYGSELSSQVQQLRELRDNSLLETTSGKIFMNSFNQFYYSFSPSIADLERQNSIFKESVKILITPMVSSLSLLNYIDMNSEEAVVGFGISVIMLNLGMYFVAPAMGIIYGRRFILK